MSNPDNAATHEDAGNSQPTHEQQVSAAVATMKKQEDGTWSFPEGDISKEVKFAALGEKRRRDTQSKYTQAQQEIASLTAQRDAFKSQLATTPTLTLSAEQTAELDTLKHSDPDAWRAKLDGYEKDAVAARDEKFREVERETSLTTETNRRQAVLEEFSAANNGFVLQDDDIPPRISKKLADGKITFEEFLTEAHAYVTNPRTTAKPSDKGKAQPNLGNLAGHDKPSEKAVTANAREAYSNTVIL